MKNWYVTKTTNVAGQGFIADEDTGEDIAVTYKSENAPLIASAPDLYEALGLAIATIERLEVKHGSFSSVRGTLDVCNAAILKAEGKG